MTRLPGVRALGVDPGTARIGLAVSDLSGTIASPLEVLTCSRSRQHDNTELIRIARREEADVIVVGLPLNMDGSMSPSARAAQGLAKALRKLADIPVEMYDERRTTTNADQSMLQAGLNAVERRSRVDKVAAAIMLQAWLDARSYRLQQP